MGKAELIKIIELYKKDMISCETLRSAVDTYSSASNGAKPIVSGSLPLVLAQVAELKQIAHLYIYEGAGNSTTISDTGIIRILEKYESYKRQ